VVVVNVVARLLVVLEELIPVMAVAMAALVELQLFAVQPTKAVAAVLADTLAMVVGAEITTTVVMVAKEVAVAAVQVLNLRLLGRVEAVA
jgi:hypothetical protein